MKKVKSFMLPILATAMLFTGCKDGNNIEPEEPAKSVGTFTQTALVEAIADMYAEWESTTTIPQELTVSGTVLTTPQYQYAMAKLLVSIRDGNTADIEVLSYKEAEHPERDSYDAEEIAVFNGPENEGNTEDLGNVADRMMAAMAENGTVPNQTIFYRSGTALAFSTNRATVCFARAIAAYAEDGTMPASVSADYTSPAPTIEAFATEYVKILDIWEKTTGTVNYVTGIGPTDNPEYAEFDKEDAHYVPMETTITVGSYTYSTADMLEIALRSYLLLRGYDGNSTTGGNGTFGTADGYTMSSTVPQTHSYIWSDAPFNETGTTSPGGSYTGNGGELRMGNAATADGIELVKTDILDNFAQRAVNYPMSHDMLIANMCGYADGQLAGYYGTFCAQRALLTFAHFFKYMLENGLSDAKGISADQTFTTVLFYDPVLTQASLRLDVTTLNYSATEETKTVNVISTEAQWTATCSESWVTIEPATGGVSTEGTPVSIKVEANTSTAREATVTFTAGSETAEVKINQNAAPSAYTIKDFATEYVKILDTWESTTGTVNYITGPGEVTEGDNVEFNVENAHYIPLETTTITVGEITYDTADMFEIALRSYLLLRGYDGNSTTGGNGTFGTVDPASLSDAIPETHNYVWAESPYNESGSTAAGNVTTGNGGGLRMGNPNTADGVELVKMDILDNFAQRAVNWPINKGSISNMCGYANGQLSGYYGCFCAHRGLVTYAHFFKYMLDNNLEDLSTVPKDQTFETHHLN